MAEAPHIANEQNTTRQYSFAAASAISWAQSIGNLQRTSAALVTILTATRKEYNSTIHLEYTRDALMHGAVFWGI